jgi:type IV pilus assembly protein PilC
LITYQYKAVTADGINTRGLVQATDEYAAVEKIKATCPIVTKITPVKEKTGILSTEVGSGKINQKSLSVMCSQFAIILRSGVNISRCMEMIAEQTEDKKLKKMLRGAAEDVADGGGIAGSFEKNCKGLPLTFLETVRAGEESGTLENSFEQMEKYYSKSYKTAQKVKRALTYPAFVIGVAVVVLIIVMAKVIPTIAVTFKDLGGQMPAMTRAMIAMSDFFAKYWLIVIAALLLMIILVKVLFNTEKGRIFWARRKLKIPVIGNINVLNGASQFANTMAVLLTAGLSVNRAVEVTAKVMDNYVLGMDISSMSGKIEEGKPLGECMRQCKNLPKTLKEMCAIGEETGELDETLATIGDYFDNEADHATAQAIAKMEPAILVVMAIFAGFIVISIYLPIFTMYNLM